jgi:hypothetical protein
MIEKINITAFGVHDMELRCHFDCTPEEPGSSICPPVPFELTLEKVVYGDVDITDELHYNEVDIIQSELERIVRRND